MNLETLLQNQDSGFAIANGIVLEDLQKALSAGYGTDAATFTGGRALMPESLDTTLVSILHTQDEAKLFKMLKKEPVSSTVHQYTKQSEVGSDDSAWVAEGGDSDETSQTLARKTVTMKYLQTLRKVTLQMATAKSIEDATALEQTAGTLWLIRNVERALFVGDSDCNEYEPDGLIKSIATANTIDLRGKTGSSENFENAMSEATRKIRDYFGKATVMFSSTMVMEDIQKLLRDRIRVPVGQGAGNYVFDVYPTKFGKPMLEDNVFIKEGSTPSASLLTTKYPGKVTFTATRAPAVTATTGASKFVTADAGDYYYKVAACNQYGEGPVSDAVQVQGIVEGDAVTITITDVGTVGTYYKVFRSKKDAADATDCRLMFRKPWNDDGGATGVVYDVNDDLPGTSSVFVLNTDPLYNAIEWNQFLPMMKFPLYPTNAAVYPFLMLLFGALNVKKSEQMARIKNISYSGQGWF